MVFNALLLIGGVFHIINGLTHLRYPKLYKWNERLTPLPDDDKATMLVSLKLSNYTILLFWLFSGIIPIVFSATILRTDIGMAFIAGIAIFWIVRVFIIQAFVVGFRTARSRIRTSYFLCCFLLFFIPLVHALA